jgi:hypothetical protein
MHGRRMAAHAYNSFSLALTDRIAGPITEPPEWPSLCTTCGVTRLARHVATKPAVSYFLSAPTVLGTPASCAVVEAAHLTDIFHFAFVSGVWCWPDGG